MTCCFFLLELVEPSVCIAKYTGSSMRSSKKIQQVINYNFSKSPDFLNKCQIEYNSKRAKDRFNLLILGDSWHHLKLLTKGIRNVVFSFD